MHDTLFIKGRKYTVDNLENLPVQLLPENVFTPSRGSITAFYTKKSTLSNHFPTKFVLNDKTYSSVEQCYMEQKATLFKDFDTATAIMTTDDPVRAKQLRGSVKNYNAKVWTR